MAVIPARGGSKRAPRKNIRPLADRPLLAYTIAAAREAGLGEATVVSTEDAEIAAVATGLGCRVVPRPPALATDAASTEGVLLHALDEAAKEGWHPTWILTLPPTSPFRRGRTIRFFMDQAAALDADCLLSVTETRADLWRRDAVRNDRPPVSRRAAPSAGSRPAVRGEQRGLPDVGRRVARHGFRAGPLAEGDRDRSAGRLRHQQ